MAILPPALTASSAAVAQDAGEVPPATMVSVIGEAVIIVLIAVAALSVLAKLSIHLGFVPREPETRFQSIIHGAANVVGRLRPARPIRDRRQSPDDRRR
ncbi:MAG: hypothetical protein KDJ88_18220 [Bauldia sp.]|nr:hypothetical protein [Bauldia sp.]